MPPFPNYGTDRESVVSDETSVMGVERRDQMTWGNRGQDLERQGMNLEETESRGPCEVRISRTVLGGFEGEVPSIYSPISYKKAVQKKLHDQGSIQQGIPNIWIGTS